MVTRDALQVVLGLRRHKEDMEERRLAGILCEKAKCDAQLEQVAGELAQITAMRLRHIEQVQNGLEYQEHDAAIRNLIRCRAEMLARMHELEQHRVQQMCHYLAARSEREVIEDVHAKREALCESARRVREQKRIEELFLARMVRRSDTDASEIGC